MKLKNEIHSMPQNTDAEALILNGILTSPDLVFDEIYELTPQHFMNRGNRIIFMICQEMVTRKMKIDFFTVQDFLKAKGKLEEIGGSYYISKLIGIPYFDIYLRDYIEILKEKYRLRKMLEIFEFYKEKCNRLDDSKETIFACEAELFKLASDSVSDENQLQSANEIVKKRIGEKKSGIKHYGIQSGLPSFDLLTGGYREGMYYTFAAQPGYGKTAWAEQSAENAVLKGIPTLIISLEMSKDRELERMTSRLSKVPLWNYLNNYMKPEDFKAWEDAQEKIAKSPLYIICPIDLTGPEFRSIVRRYKRKYGIKMVVLDYLQNMKSKNQKDERLIVKEASNYISDALKESQVAGIIISQMNRIFDKDVRPRMSHLAESGQIERDSDFIGFIWPEKHKSELSPGELLPIKLTIEKNRDGPSGNDQPLYWDGKILTFLERRENPEQWYQK